jgi:hypothetical protein
MTDKSVTTRTTTPNFWKIVSVQNKRKMVQPAVVAALPITVPPM